MAVDVLLGLQWGDEGKGKIVDLISDRYDIIARFQGGPNAGHTIIVGDKKFILHQIPSGITRDGIMNVIGNGVILDPVILKKEIDNLHQAGIDVEPRLLISRRCNLILPTHRLLDSYQESDSRGIKIGSTQKGIGPAYQDKIGRFGLRIGTIFRSTFDSEYESLKNRHLAFLESMGYDQKVDDSEWLKAIDYVRTLNFIDSEIYINEQLKSEKNILAEGAQGSLLDVDFGSYPFVTSSNTLSAAACTGLGVSPHAIRKVIGIFKAYATRVGEGPFPTELTDDLGEFLRQQGKEFGSTTGRPRRCGWLDFPALDYAITLNGVDELVMMKLDVLNDLDEISACTAYTDDEGNESNFSEINFGNSIQPVYTNFKGWKTSLDQVRSYSDFPVEVRNYVSYIENQTGKHISIISTGPERNQTVIR